MGFGGANCHAVDLDPTRFGAQNPAAAGTNGYMWWNPFATNFANQPIRNLPGRTTIRERKTGKC
jgi:hypothetical protein